MLHDLQKQPRQILQNLSKNNTKRVCFLKNYRLDARIFTKIVFSQISFSQKSLLKIKTICELVMNYHFSRTAYNRLERVTLLNGSKGVLCLRHVIQLRIVQLQKVQTVGL